MIPPPPMAIPEYRDVDRARFETEIRPLNRPAILRGQVADWPVVHAAQNGDDALVAYIRACEPTRPVRAIVADPKEGGRFFYNTQVTGLNFVHANGFLPDFLDDLLRAANDPTPPALAVQSEIISDLMPIFANANHLKITPDVAARIWIGNRIRVAAHYDLQENIGCCVSGRRRFTLFPPEQLANLYPGPFELTPAGTPVSMVDIANPDHDLYPNFAQAWATAQVAELEPGDAIYIPYMWWHAVESLSTINILVNYWWNSASTELAGPYDALLHALMAYRHMPAEQREIWHRMINHYVFETDGNPAEHLPRHGRGILSDASPETFHRMRIMLQQTKS